MRPDLPHQASTVRFKGLYAQPEFKRDGLVGRAREEPFQDLTLPSSGKSFDLFPRVLNLSFRRQIGELVP